MCIAAEEDAARAAEAAANPEPPPDTNVDAPAPPPREVKAFDDWPVSFPWTTEGMPKHGVHCRGLIPDEFKALFYLRRRWPPPPVA